MVAAVDAPVQFVLNAEGGALEKQAILACESLRRAGGAMGAAQITVVSPRADRRPMPETIRRLERLDAEYLPLDIDSPCPENGPSYKALALAHVEARPGPAILVQLDSDTVFLAEPTALAIQGAAAARPVDGKSICTTGPGDELDEFWREACALLKVDYDRIGMIQTAVTGLTVKANYNGGLVAVRRELGVYQRAVEFLRRLVRAGLRPPGRAGLSIRTGADIVEGHATRYFGINQMNFSLACAAADIAVDMLPAGYNFPVHMLDQIVDPVPAPLVHLHYHWLADLPLDAGNLLLSPRLGLPEDARQWLQSRLPL